MRYLLPISLLLLALLACSPQRRYAVLSFFLDGVPPPGGMKEGPREPSSQFIRDELSEEVSWTMTRHPPFARRECESCHPKQQAFWLGEDFDRRGACFDCHAHRNLAERLGRVEHLHGPVAVQSCLVCHDPHESLHPGLLHDADPDLCLRCHAASLVGANEAHRGWREKKCSSCHDPHGSSDRYFLKTSS